MNVAQTFGGAASLEFRQECRLMFCRQMADVDGSQRHVIAVWKKAGGPVYAVVIDGHKRSDEDVFGCALTALALAGGVDRPRLRTIERVACVLAEMMRRPAPEPLIPDWSASHQ